MFEQTFSFSDIPRVVILAFFEVFLSLDNTIVLGVITSRLPTILRSRALFIGFISAWIFRLGGIVGIAFLLEYSWLQLLGGFYLLYLMVHHFIKKKKRDPLIPRPILSFWQTVLFIELFDLAFAIDSIIAGIAFIGATGQNALLHPKLWIVYVGGMIGVFSIRYAAHFFSFMIDRYPSLETAAYLMIGWIGCKLGIQAFSWNFPHLEVLFWSVLVLLFVFGLTKRGSHV